MSTKCLRIILALTVATAAVAWAQSPEGTGIDALVLDRQDGSDLLVWRGGASVATRFTLSDRLTATAVELGADPDLINAGPSRSALTTHPADRFGAPARCEAPA